MARRRRRRGNHRDFRGRRTARWAGGFRLRSRRRRSSRRPRHGSPGGSAAPAGVRPSPVQLPLPGKWLRPAGRDAAPEAMPGCRRLAHAQRARPAPPHHRRALDGRARRFHARRRRHGVRCAAPARLSAPSGRQAGAAPRCSSAADQGPGAVLQRHARRPVPARPDGERSRHGARAVGDALAGRRRPFVPRAQVIGQNRRRRARRSRRREPALACPPMKRLVLCCDGTWNSADQESNGVPTPTNVVKLAYRVAKRDGATLQVIYYDQGVGTGNFFDRLTGGAFGDGVEANIYDAYRFLIGNYEPGDEIYLFGFSRGAYTVRSIGGMIRKCGILARSYVKYYHAAIELYRDGQHPDQPGPAKFRQDYSVSGAEAIPIRMIGAWDTVGVLGIPLRGLRSLTHAKYQFHDTELSGIVQLACHALAVDEHRAPFAPTLWTYKAKTGQQVEQVWFCGAHSDIGGGYAETGLLDIALDWMLEKARSAGLAFDSQAMAAYPLHGNPLGKLHDSKTGLYRLTPGIDRVIGSDPTQSLHPSVRQRWERDASYRPASLRSYFKRT